MAEFIEIIKKVQIHKMKFHKQLIKYNKESFSTRYKKGQYALIQSKVFQKAINYIGEKISDMDIELDQKDNKIQFLEDNVGITDSKMLKR